MEIRNLLEELAAQIVHEVCEEDEARDAPSYCTSPECRTDAVCYVLNRIPPRYVSSGRGLAHLSEELTQDQQLQIDLVRLAHEGLKKVSAVARSFYGTPAGSNPTGPCFNFPTITGRVLHGEQFFPLSDIAVTLRRDDHLVTMYDHRWSNPYVISRHTRGLYNFWPASEAADSVGIERRFEFELLLEGDGFTPRTHSFCLDITSENEATRAVSLRRDHHLPDLYLF